MAQFRFSKSQGFSRDARSHPSRGPNNFSFPRFLAPKIVPMAPGGPWDQFPRPKCSKRWHGDPFGDMFDFGLIFLHRNIMSLVKNDPEIKNVTKWVAVPPFGLFLAGNRSFGPSGAIGIFPGTQNGQHQFFCPLAPLLGGSPSGQVTLVLLPL